jgi:hypothetical protein
MVRIFTVGWTLLVLSTGTGCIIGTWPTPEEREPRAALDTHGTLVTEECDGKDNDADGTVDEGCSCNEQARGCIGTSDGICGPGIQWCLDGIWQGCSEIGEPSTLPRARQVRVVSVTPQALVRGGTETVTVTIEPTTVCAGVVVEMVEVNLSATTPVMRIRGVANDDGVAPDATRGDGVYTASFVNPFGPGVPAQTLKVGATAVIGGVDTVGNASLPLEEP